MPPATGTISYRRDELSAFGVEVGELGVGAQEEGLRRRPHLHEVLVQHVKLVLARHFILYNIHATCVDRIAGVAVAEWMEAAHKNEKNKKSGRCVCVWCC